MRLILYIYKVRGLVQDILKIEAIEMNTNEYPDLLSGGSKSVHPTFPIVQLNSIFHQTSPAFINVELCSLIQTHS